MNERKFYFLNSDRISYLLDEAKERVIYISPGISRDLSARLVNCSLRLGSENISVILDDNPQAIRLGYGSLDGIKTLELNKIEIRKQTGLRIGLLIVDDSCFVFNPTPQIIEEEPNNDETPNAILVSIEEVNQIISKLFPSSNLFDIDADAEIGKKRFDKAEIKITEKDLAERPCLKPELHRQIFVISSKFQFVELEFKGASLQNHVFSLTGQDLGISNQRLAKRIRAQYKLFESDQLSSISKIIDLQERLAKLKKRFLISIPKYGWIIYHKNFTEFDKAIKEFEESIGERKELVKKKLNEILLQSKKNIVPWMKENLKRFKEDELIEIIYPYKMKDIDVFIANYLDEKFTSSDSLLSNITFFKKITNVSDQLIESSEFREAIEKALNITFNDLVKIESVVEAKEADI